jgi:hypothetical protein
VAIAGKDGYVYGLDRATHVLEFKIPGTGVMPIIAALAKHLRGICNQKVTVRLSQARQLRI